METYRLRSRLVENDNEYLIQTANDANEASVTSIIFVNGQPAETMTCPHPSEVSSEEVLSLVKMKHGEVKREVETLLEGYRHVISMGDPLKMHHLGLAFFYRRFYAEARELFEAATRVDPQFHQAFNYLAMAQLALGDAEAASQAAFAAVEKRPGFADYRKNLGEAFLARKSCRRALMEFEEAARINLYYADAYFGIGMALILNGITHEDERLFDNLISRAVDTFNKAALVHPEYKTDTFQRGLEALKSSHLDEAWGLLGRVQEEKRERHRQEFATFYMKFVMYPEWVSDGAITERIEFLRSEIRKNPSYVDLFAELGRCYLEQGKLSWRKGIEQYRRAVDMNPSLSKIGGHLEEAEREYDHICAVLSKIAEKG